MRTGVTIALVLVSTLVIAGCSGSSNGGGAGASGGGSGGSGGGAGGAGGGGGSGSAVTSISGTKPLNTLTPDESTQLCNDAIAYFKSSITKTNSCKFSALTNAASTSAPNDTALQNNCSSMETSCNGSDAMGPGSTTGCFPPPATCAATVAQYSACVRDGVAVFNQNVSTLPSCATVTLGDLTPIFNAVEALYAAPGCMPLATACPDFVFPIAN